MARMSPWPKLGGEPTPSLTRLQSKCRQRAEQSSQNPWTCPKLETRPSFSTQPWGHRAKPGALRAGPCRLGGLQLFGGSQAFASARSND
eukprot:2278667-Alexandrium_andersonii.AAC.1